MRFALLRIPIGLLRRNFTLSKLIRTHAVVVVVHVIAVRVDVAVVVHISRIRSTARAATRTFTTAAYIKPFNGCIPINYPNLFLSLLIHAPNRRWQSVVSFAISSNCLGSRQPCVMASSAI